MGGRAGACLSRERRDRPGPRCRATRPGPIVAARVEATPNEATPIAMTFEAMTFEAMTFEAMT
jgi:hypothetical protein